MLTVNQGRLFTTMGIFRSGQFEEYLFPKGLFGLSEEKIWYVLLDNKTNIFTHIISKKDKDLIITLIQKELFSINHKFIFDEHELDSIEIYDSSLLKNCIICFVLNNYEADYSPTINLRAPIIFNPKNKSAIQVLSKDTNLSVKHNFSKVIPSYQSNRITYDYKKFVK